MKKEKNYNVLVSLIMCVHEAEYSAVLPVDEEKTTWDSPEGTKPQACSPLWASRQTQSPLPDFQRPKTPLSGSWRPLHDPQKRSNAMELSCRRSPEPSALCTDIT